MNRTPLRPLKSIALTLLVLPALLAGLGAGAASAAPLQVERVEPPDWWVGMKDPRLQLMVHGADIASAQPRLQAAGVRIERVTRTDNPNYLFIDLSLSPDVAPGALDLQFVRGGEVLHRPYTLQARRAGSAQRQGFGPADVILNLVPDRFANGDPSNDDPPGYADHANRSDISCGRHGGDIAGLRAHLGDLAAMGYTFLWPTPWLENAEPRCSYHGYAATDTYRVDPRFGSNEDYRQLVAAAEAQGIGMIQDVVLNHIGGGHWWLRDMPAHDWLTHEGHFVGTHHPRNAVADPYAARSDREDHVQGWFGPHMPDMNHANPLVATYQIQNTIWWVETAGLRGLRIDTYGYSDAAFLADWSRRVMDEYPALNMVGEEWSSNPVVVAHWLRGVHNRDGHVSSMPSMMDFPLNEALRKALTTDEGYGSGLQVLYQAMINDLLYPEPQNMVAFEGNHDMPRLYSAVGEDLGRWKLAMAWLLTAPRVPQLYYGDDLLLTSPRERDDGATRQDYPGGWAGDKVNGFTGAGLTPRQKEAQAFLRTLLNWRKTEPAVHRGRLVHFAPQDGVYVLFRQLGDRRVMVVLNQDVAAVTVDATRFREMLPAGAQARDVLTGEWRRVGERFTIPGRTPWVMVLQ